MAREGYPRTQVFLQKSSAGRCVVFGLYNIRGGERTGEEKVVVRGRLVDVCLPRGIVQVNHFAHFDDSAQRIVAGVGEFVPVGSGCVGLFCILGKRKTAKAVIPEDGYTLIRYLPGNGLVDGVVPGSGC